ncbi:unnamed protein product [Dibothriocephalus latus]|uniref:Uncharacterized protein n=1 Tax=Dibothriocephalus latus TaxID=60516 RepID=A0A3P7P6H3_DIBLA|nr:unnamed protein product [Dibothriocephalus latus]
MIDSGHRVDSSEAKLPKVPGPAFVSNSRSNYDPAKEAGFVRAKETPTSPELGMANGYINACIFPRFLPRPPSLLSGFNKPTLPRNQPSTINPTPSPILMTNLLPACYFLPPPYINIMARG